MSKRIALSFSLLFFAHIIFSQTPGKSGKFEFPQKVDISAEYPGGIEELYRFIQRHLVYPIDAQKNKIEGKTFIEFIVSESGYIIPGSVQALKELYPSCDAESIRVIKLCTTRWKPAMKNGKPVNQSFVLPIAFSLTESTIPVKPEYLFEHPIKTVVTGEFIKSEDPKVWMIYTDGAMKNNVGQVPVGDSVAVVGWSSWAFFIETETLRGYISWKALKTTEEMQKISSYIDLQSTTQNSQNESLKALAKKAKANAYLSLTSSKQQVYAGECVTVTLAFNVHEYNPAPLQFFELGQQLSEMLPALTPDYCWKTENGIEDVLGESKMINNETFISYAFYKANYCPANPGQLAFPGVTLKVAKVRPSSKEVDTLLAFASKPLALKVNALPTGITPSGSDGYRLVGKFEISDSVLTHGVYAGMPVNYTVTVSGEGLTFPLDPPKIKLPNVKAHLCDIVYTDTLIQEQLHSSKTFIYQLIFEKPAVYDLRGKIAFTYFNTDIKKLAMLKSVRSVTVAEAVNAGAVERPKTFGSKNNFIAIDASRSMAIEDYKPHRLGAVKSGLKEFLMSRDTCDIGLILFGGDAKHYALSSPDKCYTRKFIDSIDFYYKRRGTAIGDAIWLATSSFAEATAPKKLVIIGDGDNTAGRIPPKFAATLAKKHNITIYTIGIGASGLVPFGKDSLGRPNMIDNTFTDKDFRIISSMTHGKYYWAKDEQEVNRILKTIFQ